MKEFFLNNIAPIIATGIFGILVKMIAPIGDEVIQLISKAKTYIEQKAIVSGHEQQYKLALESWHEIDEKWRITPNVEEFLSSKGDYFISLMKKKMPLLTDDEIISLRQAIAGEINKGKASVLNQTDIINQLQTTNTQLSVENANLKNQLNQIQTAITSNNVQI